MNAAHCAVGMLGFGQRQLADTTECTDTECNMLRLLQPDCGLLTWAFVAPVFSNKKSGQLAR